MNEDYFYLDCPSCMMHLIPTMAGRALYLVCDRCMLAFRASEVEEDAQMDKRLACATATTESDTGGVFL
jgi:hypothetical protein